MLSLLCHIEVLAYTSALLLIETIEEEGTSAIGEAELIERAHQAGLEGFEEALKIALLNNGWIFYGDDETGMWRDDTRAEDLASLTVSARLNSDPIRPMPEQPPSRERPTTREDDESDFRWH